MMVSDKFARVLDWAVPALAIGAVVTMGSAVAGTAGTEFDAIYATLTGWMEGTLGRLIALAALIGGLAAGVVRSAVTPFLVGIGVALGINVAPGIMDGIVTATLPEGSLGFVAQLPVF